MGKANTNHSSSAGIEIRKELSRSRSLLSPVERISEILFGLLMALTFTCTISVAEADSGEVRTTLIAALGCNIAWGLVDAVMYVLTSLAERGRNRNILHYVRTTNQHESARQFIADALPPLIASVMDQGKLESIRKSLLGIPESATRVRLTKDDLKIAVGIFFLVFFSTFPVVIPFLFVKDDPRLALRISNLVAIVLMFVCGWLLAGYGGYNKLRTSLILTVIGVGLVLLTIQLGG
jgi:VIT1/CCC1 family predicted Fe2+/Mn2+ transporter